MEITADNVCRGTADIVEDRYYSGKKLRKPKKRRAPYIPKYNKNKLKIMVIPREGADKDSSVPTIKIDTHEGTTDLATKVHKSVLDISKKETFLDKMLVALKGINKTAEEMSTPFDSDQRLDQRYAEIKRETIKLQASLDAIGKSDHKPIMDTKRAQEIIDAMEKEKPKS